MGKWVYFKFLLIQIDLAKVLTWSVCIIIFDFTRARITLEKKNE